MKAKKKARRLPTFPPREAVSSALESLTSVFGMGTGISSPLWPPDNVYKSSFCPPACGSAPARQDTVLCEKPSPESPAYGGINNMVKPHDLLVMLG